MSNASIIRFILIVTALWAVVQVCRADAGDAPVDVGVVYAPLTVCISPYVVAHDRQVFARAAVARGYDVFVGHLYACSVTLFVGDCDATGAEWIVYDEARKLHRGRATDLLIAWEARLSVAEGSK